MPRARRCGTIDDHLLWKTNGPATGVHITLKKHFFLDDGDTKGIQFASLSV